MAEPVQPDNGDRPGAMSVEDYFRWRDGRDEPWEYVDGRPVPKFPAQDDPLVAMASGSASHHTIQVTCASLIRARRPKRCRVATDATVEVENGRRIPDVVMSCAPAGPGLVMAEPVLMVEVTSPSSRTTDFNLKPSEYSEIPSVREIWVVEGHRRRVRSSTRTERGWQIIDTIGSGAFRPELLGTEITLDEIYEDTEV
jgi:Uma2 family endonuclease